MMTFLLGENRSLGLKRPGTKQPGAKRRYGETSRGRTGSGVKRPRFLNIDQLEMKHVLVSDGSIV